MQLVVYRDVGRNHEEIFQTVLRIEIGDERSHQACLPHAGRQCKGEGKELPLEVRACGIKAMYLLQCVLEVDALLRRHGLKDVRQHFQGNLLRFSQRHRAADKIRSILEETQVSIHHPRPHFPRPRTVAGAQCSERSPHAQKRSFPKASGGFS